jgi:hypothetical protein
MKRRLKELNIDGRRIIKWIIMKYSFKGMLSWWDLLWTEFIVVVIYCKWNLL